ncbi:MAG: hypothetical protein C0498_11845 [Anaerolinea sp.]|nr:hypothetical protein [Anaerolinea sp.]
MSEAFGISHGGESAEARFRELTGAKSAPTASDGDVLLEGYPVEIKRATTSTLNQVRAVKYIPLVAYYAPEDAWYVVPAHIVVAEAANRSRGQHTEIPFESITLNLKRLSAFRVEEGELWVRTLEAIEQGGLYPELRHEMTEVRKRARAVAQDSVARVHALLERYQIEVPAGRSRRRMRP